MLAQGTSGVLGAEQPPVLEDRHNVVDEVLQAARQMRRHHIETVGGSLREPLFELVGDLLRGPGEDPVAAAAAEARDELAQGEAVAPGQFGDQGETALVAVDVPLLGQRGQRTVQRQPAQVRAEHPRQLGESVLRHLKVGQLLLKGAGPRLRRGDDRADAGKDLQIVLGTSVAGKAVLHVLVEGLPVGEGLLCGEHGLGVLGGELLAVLGRTGLHQ